MGKKVSMKDIAKEVGVSTALVSFVLNNKFTNRINVETAKKIKDVAQSLNYFPNQIATSLRKNKTFTIGLVIADIANLFSSSIARLIEDECKKHGYNVIFGSADENVTKFNEVVNVLVSRRVDGIILAAPAETEKSFEYLKEIQIPFVLIDRCFPTVTGINSIIIDNYKSSYEVVELLARNGYKRPAMLTLSSNLFHMNERTRGFVEAANKILGINSPRVIEIPEEELLTKTEEVIMNLIGVGVDAIYFSTNRIGMEGLAVVAKHKIKVPDEMGIVCFDEADAYKIFNTSITFVRQPLEQMSSEAVGIILALIEGQNFSKNVSFNTHIVAKDSSAPVARDRDHYSFAVNK